MQSSAGPCAPACLAHGVPRASGSQWLRLIGVGLLVLAASRQAHAAGNCRKPSGAVLNSTDNWCGTKSILYSTDCDGDTYDDWACTTGSVYYVALSSKGCTPAKATLASCTAVFDATPNASSTCPPAKGFIAQKDKDAPGNDIGGIWDSPAGRLLFDEELGDTVGIAGYLCTVDPKCVAFNTVGQFKSSAAKTVTRTDTCLYAKNSACSSLLDTIKASKAWCPQPYTLFQLDCDDDGYADWACHSEQGAYAVALSSRSCVVANTTRSKTAAVYCKPAFMAVDVTEYDGVYVQTCPSLDGYEWRASSEVRSHDLVFAAALRPAGDSDTASDSSSDSIGPTPAAAPAAAYYTSLRPLLEELASACNDTEACKGFDSLGYLKDKVTGEEMGRNATLCTYSRILECNRPSAQDSWCTPTGAVFEIDCDDDSWSDWACLERDGNITRLFAERECRDYTTEEALDFSMCPALAVRGDCPQYDGWSAHAGKDLAVWYRAQGEQWDVWLGDEATQPPTRDYVDVQDMMDELLKVVARYGCYGFSSAGHAYCGEAVQESYLEERPGVCFYIRDGSGQR